MASLLVRNARIHGSGAVDVEVEDGRISAVRAAGSVHDWESVVDAQGALLLPTLVDGHCHPDKTAWDEPWVSRQPAATLEELIANDVLLQRSFATPVRTRAERLLGAYVAAGARAVRAHVDVAPVYGLDNIRGVVEAADALADALHVEVVAFPQLGVMRTPGTAELMRESVAAGATVIGGIDPGGLDGDLHGQLDTVFGLAIELGVSLDIHLHDGGEHGMGQVREIIRRTHDAGLEGRVAIGHAFCYSDCDDAQLTALGEATAAAGITLATCALGDSPVLPVARLQELGCRVVLGSDGVRDAWSPFGNGNMLDRTHLLAWRTGAVTDAELEACLDVAAHAGADFLGLERSGLRVGDPADFMLVPGEVPAQVVIDRPLPHYVFRAGRVVARDGALTAIPATF
ncbi:MAG TPA: amidohydrolase [Nocardioides sp.]|uniref:amidohydrolase n=1 Tax=Nocardioides sp. TaxID=35761 RepID=UPI002ED939D9